MYWIILQWQSETFPEDPMTYGSLDACRNYSGKNNKTKKAWTVTNASKFCYVRPGMVPNYLPPLPLQCYDSNIPRGFKLNRKMQTLLPLKIKRFFFWRKYLRKYLIRTLIWWIEYAYKWGMKVSLEHKNRVLIPYELLPYDLHKKCGLNTFSNFTFVDRKEPI